jgi:hypothetical protein
VRRTSSDHAVWFKGVSIAPGAIALTVMPWSASSSASTLVMATIAPLAAV